MSKSMPDMLPCAPRGAAGLKDRHRRFHRPARIDVGPGAYFRDHRASPTATMAHGMLGELPMGPSLLRGDRGDYVRMTHDPIGRCRTSPMPQALPQAKPAAVKPLARPVRQMF